MRLGAIVVVALVIAVGIFAARAEAGPVNADIFSGVSATPAGDPYSTKVCTVNSSDIMFATNTGYNWHPCSPPLSGFGADITSLINVTSNGTYAFALNSDDGSRLFIDNAMIIDNGGGHGPTTVTNSTVLTAGSHNLEVRFFECCGGASGVDLTLPQGVAYSSISQVPEPSTLALMATSFTAFGASTWWRRRKVLRGLRRWTR